MQISSIFSRFAKALIAGFLAWLAIYIACFAIETALVVLALLGAPIGGAISILGIVPMLAIYGVVGWIGWCTANRAWYGAAFGLILVAVTPSLVINVLIDRRVAAAKARDIPFTAIASQPQSVALLLSVNSNSSGDRGAGGNCNNLCQRMLYGGGIASVQMGRSPLHFDLNDPVKLTKYRIERRPKCPAVAIPDAGEIAGERSDFTTPVSSAVRLRVADGECLIASEATHVDADLVWTEGQPDNPRSEYQPISLDQMRVSRFELLRRTGRAYVPAGRLTHVQYSKASTPFFGQFTLNVIPSLIISTTSEHQSGPYPSVSPVTGLFKPWLQRPDVSFAQLSVVVDRALADGPVAKAYSDTDELPAEQLYWAYIDRLAATKTGSADDTRRLARIIESGAFFPQRRYRDAFPVLERAIAGLTHQPQIIGEAILRRGATETPSEANNQRLFSALSQAIKALPPGTFKGPSALLDQTVADPVRRGKLPGAVYRISDRGALAAPILLRILNENLDSYRGDQIDSGQWPSSLEAVSAICRIAPVTPGAALETQKVIERFSAIAPHAKTEIKILHRAHAVMGGAEPRKIKIQGQEFSSC